MKEPLRVNEFSSKSRQMQLDFTQRGFELWLRRHIGARLPEPPRDSRGKKLFSKSTAIAVFDKLDDFLFELNRRGTAFTLNDVAIAAGLSKPKERKGQHSTVRHVVRWFEQLGLVSLERSTRGGFQAVAVNFICYPNIAGVVVDGETLIEPETLPSVVSQTDKRCESDCEPLQVRLTSVVSQTANRCEADSQPSIKHLQHLKHKNTSTLKPTRKSLSVEALGEEFFKLGVGTAHELVEQALKRDCSVRSLEAILRWFQRSQRSNPKRWDKPSSVLYGRLKNASPSVAAFKGWFEGRPLQQRKPKRELTVDYSAAKAAARAEFKGSMAEDFKALMRAQQLSKLGGQE